MPDQQLRSKSLDDVVNGVQALAAVASAPQVKSIAAVAARCAIEFADSIKALNDMVFTAKKQMVERLDALGAQIKAHEQAMTAASEETSRQTQTILSWNRALVIVTGIYTLISFSLLLVTILRK